MCVAAKCGNKKRRNVTGNGMTTTRRAALLGLPGFLAGAGGADGATLDGLKQSTESEALKELRNLRERTEETEEESYERLENLLQQLSADRQKYEEEAREEAFNSNRLCRTPFGVDVVGLTETIALIGATVGGLVARRRKKDVEKLNDKLRSVNLSLRQQARAGTLYAPALNYAPAPAPPQAQSQAAQVPEAGVERQEEMNETRAALKKARRLVKEGNPSSAMVHFNKALVETRRSGDRILERRAVRGLAACKRDLVRSFPASLVKTLFPAAATGKAFVMYAGRRPGGDRNAPGRFADIR